MTPSVKVDEYIDRLNTHMTDMMASTNIGKKWLINIEIYMNGIAKSVRKIASESSEVIGRLDKNR